MNVDYNHKPYSYKRTKAGFLGFPTYEIYYDDTPIRSLNNMVGEDVRDIVGLLNSAFLLGQMHLATYGDKHES